jgi:hypothetical protein
MTRSRHFYNKTTSRKKGKKTKVMNVNCIHECRRGKRVFFIDSHNRPVGLIDGQCEKRQQIEVFFSRSLCVSAMPMELVWLELIRFAALCVRALNAITGRRWRLADGAKSHQTPNWSSASCSEMQLSQARRIESGKQALA